jgi:hypothetical protein
MKHKLEIVKGVQGLAVYLNDVRISPRGTKPLGGGKTLVKWLIADSDLREASERTDLDAERAR